MSFCWIIIGFKKGRGAVVWPLGCWGIVTQGCSLFQCYLLPVAIGRVSSVLVSSNFQSWGQAQKSKMAVVFNKVTGLLANGAMIANGAGFVLSIGPH